MPDTHEGLELFDLASQDPRRCWSFHVWKIRPVLAYKNLPYSTTWLDHNTTTSTLRALGVPQHPSGPYPWTVPTIRFPDGSLTMDSFAIAAKIQEQYPESPLNIDRKLEEEAEQTVYGFCFPLFAMYMPRTAQDIVVPSALAAFRAPREAMFGASLEDLAKTPSEAAWAGAKPGLDNLVKFLTQKKVDQGPFILGSKISFADFIIAAVIKSFKQSGKDLYEGIINHDRVIAEHYKTIEPYQYRGN